MKCLLAWCLCACAYGSNYEDFAPPLLPMLSLISSAGKQTLSVLLQENSLVSVTDIPGLKEAREKVFETLENCFVIHPEVFENTVLPDGTQKNVLATGVFSFQPAENSLPLFEDKISTGCSEFSQATNAFRLIISEISSLFCASLDKSDMKNAPFMSALENGQQLEHFIVYSSTSSVTNSTSTPASASSTFRVALGEKIHTLIEQFHEESDLTIDMHVDEGLFIALVPPLLLPQRSSDNNTNNNKNISGLVIQTKAGERKNVVFPDSSSVLFMIGDGLKRWMKTSLSLNAVSHALKMSVDTRRMWYGRMFLPPPTQFSSEVGLTFGMYRQLVVTNSPEAMVGCLAGGVGIRDTQCNASEYYCWMRCFKPSELPQCDAGQPYVCLSNTDGQPCDPNAMGCNPRCGNAPPVAFCNPSGAMTMFMNGFASPAENQSCVIFLFQGWIMDTRFKFFCGCIASIVLGMIAEWLISMRRGLSSWCTRLGPSQLKLLELCFYVFQATLGYVLMLLAMTYSVPIFFCVLIGLMLGHMIFVTRKSATVASSAGTPCCEGIEHQIVFKDEEKLNLVQETGEATQ